MDQLKLSVVIPAYNEAESLPETIRAIYAELVKNNIEHEILVINDNAKDTDTPGVLNKLKAEIPSLGWLTNEGPNGFGFAVRKGLENFKGDCVAIMMADLSDSPTDLILFYKTMVEGNYDAVFGTRWSKGGKVYDYPFIKRVINRMANSIIRICFGIKYNDTTNAFKMYKRKTIEGLHPLLSPHFNFTIELPLKVIIRGYSYAVVPNSWRNRKFGVSKLKIREMGTRYLFILLYCLIEKFFSKKDFNKKWD
jgi:dolichol-phosphate mannosyltransferase